MISGQKGMTLVEVTVATVIFSMIMLATVTALRAFAGTYAKLEEMTARTTQMREADRFLRVILRSAINHPDFFEGGLHTLQWVAPIDRVGSAGGLQHLRLTREGNRLARYERAWQLYERARGMVLLATHTYSGMLHATRSVSSTKKVSSNVPTGRICHRRRQSIAHCWWATRG